MDESPAANKVPDRIRRASEEMLVPLARRLAGHRRFAGVNDQLERRIRELDRFAWHYERGLPAGGICVPFVLFGPQGVFLLAGSSGPCGMDDFDLLAGAGNVIAEAMPGYPSPVRTAIVLIGQEQEPCTWFNNRGIGGWLLGERWLQSWLAHFEDYGFSEADIARLRDLAEKRSALGADRRILIPTGSG